MARHLPDWPRMMRRDLCLLYLDMGAAEFERAVNAGTLPAPHTNVGDKERWSRTELDAYLERLTGEGAPEWQNECKLFRDEAA